MSAEVDRILAKLREASRSGDVEAVAALSAQLQEAMRESAPGEPARFVDELRSAVDAFDRKRVGELCELLVTALWQRTELYPFEHAKSVLDLLRRKRHFDEMARVAEVLLQTGQDAPRIRRQYAQALLDRRQIAAALAVLARLREQCEKAGDQSELNEALGLVGRAYKQIYMDAAGAGGSVGLRRDSLTRAVESYARPFNEDSSNTWHGINAVALLARAARDGIEIGPPPLDLKTAAEGILSRIAAQDDPGRWDLSTAGEACLALGEYDVALEWIAKYTADEEADAFEFASTLRQFEEVWSLRDREPAHAKILNALRSAVIEREGGSVSLVNAAEGIAGANELIGDATYEAVLGDVRYQKYKLMVKGLNQAKIVAKIETRAGAGHGTGFLFPGPSVHPSITDAWVIITNAHVISNAAEEQGGVPGALAPDEALVRFEAWDDPEETYKLGDILFSSGRTELDCSIVTLRPQPAFAHEFDIPKRLPRADGRQRVYVIGHPRGGALSVSLQDNALLDHEVPRVHYRAPTEGGSSGSPVFSGAWDLIGLHHAGGPEMKMLHGKQGTYPANEGIWIRAVLEAAAAALE